ncbi:cupin domain-containing protein [Mobilitalea sibirica]|uniref:Cupin domain-containing protein n=2 Tax=Mobilitalea sibirica TaxID=1462919 RepID=A0A8J7H842_9FIRM|nr:cupin domain-containing protein [Mobilitalea sibirica]MBH1939965.1 cupin domain-containing protein [Mobilitalea sibirica]
MYQSYPCPYCGRRLMLSPSGDDNMHTCPYCGKRVRYHGDYNRYDRYYPPYKNMDHGPRFDYSRFKDYGSRPYVVNIDEVTKENDTFRTALWTGKHLQLTLMSIDVGGEIGLEIHPDVDQFIRVEEGHGVTLMGDHRDRLNFQAEVYDDYAILIPAGKWHNLINTGNKPLKLYSIYAPPEHPFGTVHKTKADAMEDHHDPYH